MTLPKSTKDLNKEGFNLNKLHCILKQFPDVIQIVNTPAGVWVAYPTVHTTGTGQIAGSMAVPTYSEKQGSNHT